MRDHSDNAVLLQDRWEDPVAEYALPRDAGKAGIFALRTQCNGIAKALMTAQRFKPGDVCNTIT